ncbi:MAG: ISNCY family transposase [Planctomycetaceae bacterium]|nr:ISNCY family transposase [Planctomycetaceae bacterium]
MRKPFSAQTRLDAQAVPHVQPNLDCRAEIVPVLAGLQYIYSQAELRTSVLELVAQDINEKSRSDRGREGLDYWHIAVLAGVRLGCNLDYDKLQDLAEQHRAMRQIMGIGDWQECIDFSWRRIRDNVALLKPETIAAISHKIVDEAYELEPDAVEKQRADSFVVETDIHYPTESSLMVDGVRKIIELCVCVAEMYDIVGWRQHEHLLRRAKQINRQIARIAARKGANYQARMEKQYRKLLSHTEMILSRATQTCESLENGLKIDLATIGKVAEIEVFMQRTRQVCGTARRRVLEGETVPNEDKLFSIFEPHTQLYRRGKAGETNQYGRLVLVYEDTLGFITHHRVMPRDVQDQDVAVEQTRIVQERLRNRIKEISFDRGFHSPENQIELAAVVDEVCLPKPGSKQAVEQQAAASMNFHKAKQRHPGIESAIGALQSGNGLKRCRDVGEVGFERYVALAVLGRNLHALGKLLIARQQPESKAAISHRAA